MFIIQTIILGLCLGFVYALMATGLTLIFGVMRIVNLAHPIFILVGAFVAYYLFRPTSKKEEDNFNSKNNWRGGF